MSCKNYGVVQWLPRDDNDTTYRPSFNTISLRGFFDHEKRTVEIAPSNLVIDAVYRAYFVDDAKAFPATKQKYRVKLLLVGKLKKLKLIRSILIHYFKNFNFFYIYIKFRHKARMRGQNRQDRQICGRFECQWNSFQKEQPKRCNYCNS